MQLSSRKAWIMQITKDIHVVEDEETAWQVINNSLTKVKTVKCWKMKNLLFIPTCEGLKGYFREL